MDRGTKLMMALSSMLGALGVAGIVIFALLSWLWSFLFKHDCASAVQLNGSLLLLYSSEMQSCLAKDFEKTHGIVRLVAGIELILFTIEWVFVSQLSSQPMVITPMILQLIFLGIILVQMNKACVYVFTFKKVKS